MFRLAELGDFLHNCSTALMYGGQEVLADQVASIATFSWTMCRSINGDVPDPANTVGCYILSWFEDRDWDEITSEDLFSLVVMCEILAGKG